MFRTIWCIWGVLKINAVSNFNLHYLQRCDANHLAGSLNTGWLAYNVSNTWRILSSSRSWQKSWPESRWISTQLQSSAPTISRRRSTLSTCNQQSNVKLMQQIHLGLGLQTIQVIWNQEKGQNCNWVAQVEAFKSLPAKFQPKCNYNQLKV